MLLLANKEEKWKYLLFIALLPSFAFAKSTSIASTEISLCNMKIELTEFKPGQNDPYELRNAIKVSYYGLEPEQVSSCDEVRTYIDFHGQRVVTNGADAAVINFDNQSMESIHSRERIPTIYIQIKNFFNLSF